LRSVRWRPTGAISAMVRKTLSATASGHSPLEGAGPSCLSFRLRLITDPLQRLPTRDVWRCCRCHAGRFPAGGRRPERHLRVSLLPRGSSPRLWGWACRDGYVRRSRLRRKNHLPLPVGNALVGEWIGSVVIQHERYGQLDANGSVAGGNSGVGGWVEKDARSAHATVWPKPSARIIATWTT